MIGVDVIKFAVGANTQARCDRHNSFFPKSIQQFRVCSGEIADVAEAACHIVVYQRFGGEALRVGGGNSDGRLTCGGNRRGQLFVQQSGKNHYCGVACFSIGHTKSRNEFAFDAQTL